MRQFRLARAICDGVHSESLRVGVHVSSAGFRDELWFRFCSQNGSTQGSYQWRIQRHPVRLCRFIIACGNPCVGIIRSCLTHDFFHRTSNRCDLRAERNSNVDCRNCFSGNDVVSRPTVDLRQERRRPCQESHFQPLAQLLATCKFQRAVLLNW